MQEGYKSTWAAPLGDGARTCWGTRPSPQCPQDATSHGQGTQKKKGTFSDTMKMGGGGHGLPLLLSRFALGGRLDTAQGHCSFLELQQEPCQVREEGRSQKNRKIIFF